MKIRTFLAESLTSSITETGHKQFTSAVFLQKFSNAQSLTKGKNQNSSNLQYSKDNKEKLYFCISNELVLQSSNGIISIHIFTDTACMLKMFVPSAGVNFQGRFPAFCICKSLHNIVNESYFKLILAYWPFFCIY